MPPEPAPIQRVTLTIGGAALTIMPRRAPVGESAPIRGHTLAIFQDAPSTREDPSSEEGGRLISLLPEGRRDLLAATIEPGARPAWAVLDLGQDEALAVGHALGLTEMLFWDGRRAHLLPCDV